MGAYCCARWCSNAVELPARLRESGAVQHTIEYLPARLPTKHPAEVTLALRDLRHSRTFFKSPVLPLVLSANTDFLCVPDLDKTRLG